VANFNLSNIGRFDYIHTSSYVEASVEFVSGSVFLRLIIPGNVFEKDLVGRAADNMRHFCNF